MSATCDWLNNGSRVRVTVVRWGGPGISDGYWEARVLETGGYVPVRPEDLRDAFTITVSPASSEDGAA